MVPWTGAILILVVSFFRRDLRRRREDFITVIGYAVYVALAIEAHIMLIQWRPHTYDAALLAIDHRLGFDTIAVAAAISRHGFLMVAIILGYILLPAMIGLAWVLEQNFRLRRAVIIGGCLCFFFYALIPAVGPAWYDFAANIPKYAPRNALPSMHFTWALLLALNAKSRTAKLIFWPYAVLIAVATIALGEHYLIDLIAALPWTVFLQWASRKEFAIGFAQQVTA